MHFFFHSRLQFIFLKGYFIFFSPAGFFALSPYRVSSPIVGNNGVTLRSTIGLIVTCVSTRPVPGAKDPGSRADNRVVVLLSTVSDFATKLCIRVRVRVRFRVRFVY